MRYNRVVLENISLRVSTIDTRADSRKAQATIDRLLTIQLGLMITKIQKRYIDHAVSALGYRVGKTVSQYIVYENGHFYWICPSCDITIDRDYQSYCTSCGQKLKW
jgi:hypothetical protein